MKINMNLNLGGVDTEEEVAEEEVVNKTCNLVEIK